MTRFLSVFVLLIAMTALSACGTFKGGEAKYPTGADRAATGNDIYKKPDSIFGGDGLRLFGGRDKGKGTGANGIDVNSYLWRAALDTVSFMPLASADPFGGVILTDWYTSDDTPNERVKLNVFILDRQLTANGISVKVFRQVKGRGGWVDAKAAPETARQLEDAILTRARQIRIAERDDE